jgi:hypothetical protein
MECFLSEWRRHELINNLVELGIPMHVATEEAGYSADLRQLDHSMSDVVNRLAERFRELVNAVQRHDDASERQFRTFLQADLLVHASYSAEIQERHVPGFFFPETNRSTDEARATAGECKQLILTAMGQIGSLQ